MDIVLGLDGDVLLKNGKASLIQTTEELVAQRLRNRLSINRGEWPFNVNAGLPWVQDGDTQQLLYKTSEDFFISVIKEVILQDALISKVSNYTTNWDKLNGIYSADINVELVNGVELSLTV